MTTTNNTLNAINEVINAKAADAAEKYGYHFNYMPVPTWEGPVNPLWLNDCPCARFLMN